ncbi:MAG: NACHT domain-containing protein [Hormoscilla sp. GM102CHS1]|nr:NACHT domain-containing protein [Hormoscilla sp. GM102CHS1]
MGKTRILSDRLLLQSRHQLLEAMKNQVQGRLEQSLHRAVLKDLVRDRQAEPLRRDINIKIGGSLTFQLPPETSLREIFDQNKGVWLILGLPGAGKTTTLLELAQELIANAQRNQPVPVLFDLSTWQGEPLADWLVRQLEFNYSLQVKIGRMWLDNGQLLLLLDGLERLELERQEQCIEAINHLLEKVSEPLNMIACYCLEEYKSCKNKLRLNGAAWLQPLRDTQIRDYLISARSRELWQCIYDEPQLLALAKKPLLLSVMTLADEEILIHSWRRITSDRERHQYLLNAYMRRMLTVQINQGWYGRGKHPRPELTRHWLIWLANRMKQENLSEFLIEKMPPTWLPNSTQRRIYRLGVGAIGGLTIGLITGVSVGLVTANITQVSISGISAGLLAGLLAGMMSKPEKIVMSDRAIWPGVQLWQRLINLPGCKWILVLVTGLILGSVLGLGLRFGLVGLGTGLVAVPVVGLASLILGQIMRLTIPNIGGRTFPNQGIKQSAIIFGVVAPTVGLLAGGVAGLATGYFSSGSHGWLAGLVAGLVSWLAIALYPGLACIQHLMLRLLLYRSGAIPWNYGRFLNYATSRLLLQRWGGSYQFRHDLLQEHFAQLEELNIRL